MVSMVDMYVCCTCDDDVLQCMTEREDGKEELAPPILQLSSEKMTRYGIFLMDYGLVSIVSCAHVFRTHCVLYTEHQ